MTAIELINALAPRRQVRFVGGLSYGPGARHGADVYVPAAITSAAPVVVFYYGGGWTSGERADYRFVGAALAARGIMVVLPDYRLFPEVDFNGFLDDAARAFTWARGIASAHGGDPGRVLVMGHSAGAYIAAMLALAPGLLDVPYRPEAAIGLAGPYDFEPGTAELKAIFPGGRACMPARFARRDAPPMLLAAGNRDRTVLPVNTARLAAALRAAGNTVVERQYRGIGHRLVLGAIARPLQVAAPVLADCLGFIAEPSARAVA